MAALNITDDKQQSLYQAGPETQEIFETLTNTGEDYKMDSVESNGGRSVARLSCATIMCRRSQFTIMITNVVSGSRSSRYQRYEAKAASYTLEMYFFGTWHDQSHYYIINTGDHVTVTQDYVNVMMCANI